jgi:hypothetical protein
MEVMVDAGSRREKRADRKLPCAGDCVKFAYSVRDPHTRDKVKSEINLRGEVRRAFVSPLDVQVDSRTTSGLLWTRPQVLFICPTACKSGRNAEINFLPRLLHSFISCKLFSNGT